MSDKDLIRQLVGEGRAVTASGCVAFLDREEFTEVLKRQEEPLVVCSLRGTLRYRHTYLTSYRGILFAHRTKTPIELEGYDLINAEEIRFAGRRVR
jgi:hypothetical protein